MDHEVNEKNDWPEQAYIFLYQVGGMRLNLTVKHISSQVRGHVLP